MSGAHQAAVGAALESDDTTAPSAPGTPTVTSNTPGSISIQWTASSDSYGIQHYEVYACSDSLCASQTMFETSTDTSATYSSASSGNTYRFRVRAVDNNDNIGPYSGILSVVNN
jgi:mannan endo-1,4-beta-mannosidase